MATAPSTLHCANPRCQAPHEGHASVCQQCGTPLIRRYLWAVGPLPKLEPGQLLGERYWVVEDGAGRSPQLRVLLDTQPGMLPEVPDVGQELPKVFLPYLRLLNYRHAIPQVYGLLSLDQTNVFLLEDAPLYGDHAVVEGVSSPGGLPMPGLLEQWSTSTPHRQLGWLWQLARLWGPLHQEGVAQTLLEPDYLRVDGSLVRILELYPQGEDLDLSQLGLLWQNWIDSADRSLRPFLRGLCDRLIAGCFETPESLVACLDRALAIAAETLTTDLQVATCTDSGPHRSHNEDACLPAGGTFRMTRSGPQSITIVCDGLGGHDGGEVAARMAADTIHRYLQTPENLENTPPGLAMQKAFYLANDQLTDRNNQEKRLQRQRMGTTVVATWLMNHLFYLGHVGDSRIYRITPQGCQQLTVDDDVGSQSVLQGQNIYRQAIRPSSAGALTQALGITPSNVLRPTVQRFFFEEETVLLLCSDGLSDHERVSEVWPHILLPIFTQPVNVALAASQLLEVANQRNGHDNSTIALMHYRVSDRQPPDASALVRILEAISLPAGSDATIGQKPRRRSPRSKVPRSAQPQRLSLLSKLVLLLGGLALCSALGYGLHRTLMAEPEPTPAQLSPRPPLLSIHPLKPIPSRPLHDWV